MNGEPHREHEAQARLAVNAMWTAVGLVLIGVVRIASGIAAESFFGVDGLAHVTAALSVAAIATIAGSAGLSAGITKLISELRGQTKPHQARRFATFATRVALVLSVAGAVAGGGYALVDESLRSGGPLVVASTALLTLVFGSYLAGKAAAFGEGLIRHYVILEFLGVGAFAMGFWLIVLVDSPRGVILPLIAAYLPVGMLAVSRAARRYSTRSDLPIRPLIQYGTIGTVGSLAGVGFTRVTPLVAGYLAGTAGIALVGASLFILEPLYLAPRAISLVLLPGLSFANASAARRASADTVRTATGVVAALAAPFCALLVLERDRILQIVFSEQIIGGATLGWFAAAFFVSVIGTPAITALAAIRARDASIPMWSSLVGLALAVVTWAIAGPSHGTVAVAVGYALGSLVQVTVPILLASRRYQIVWRGLLIRIGVGMAMVAILTLMEPSINLDLAAVFGIALLFIPELRTIPRLALSGKGRSSDPTGQ
jgi:O-antigen/teichoic acid export membrane protein